MRHQTSGMDANKKGMEADKQKWIQIRSTKKRKGKKRKKEFFFLEEAKRTFVSKARKGCKDQRCAMARIGKKNK